MLQRGTNLMWSLIKAFDCMQALQRFTVSDLSNLYIDVAKDRLYVRGQDSLDRR